MFKYGAFLNKPNYLGGENFHTIHPGETLDQVMERTGMGKIGLVFAENICRVPDGKGSVIEVTSGKPALYLNNVPWTDNGIQDLDRKVKWYNGVDNAGYTNILTRLSEQYPVESVVHAGSSGEFIIFQFSMPGFNVDRDPNGEHTVLLTIAENRHNGNKYFGTLITRIFCENQFARLGREMRAMPAGQDAALVLDFQVKVEESRLAQIEALNGLFKKQIRPNDKENLAEILFPTPKPRRVVADVAAARDSGVEVSLDSDDPTMQQMTLKERNALRDYDAALVRNDAHVEEFFALAGKHEAELGANRYALWQAATEKMSPGKSELVHSDMAQQQLNAMFGEQQKSLERAWTYVNK